MMSPAPSAEAVGSPEALGVWWRCSLAPGCCGSLLLRATHAGPRAREQAGTLLSARSLPAWQRLLWVAHSWSSTDVEEPRPWDGVILTVGETEQGAVTVSGTGASQLLF